LNYVLASELEECRQVLLPGFCRWGRLHLDQLLAGIFAAFLVWLAFKIHDMLNQEEP
jgi:hypothetical protein